MPPGLSGGCSSGGEESFRLRPALGVPAFAFPADRPAALLFPMVPAQSEKLSSSVALTPFLQLSLCNQAFVSARSEISTKSNSRSRPPEHR